MAWGSIGVTLCKKSKACDGSPTPNSSHSRPPKPRGRGFLTRKWKSCAACLFSLQFARIEVCRGLSRYIMRAGRMHFAQAH